MSQSITNVTVKRIKRFKALILWVIYVGSILVAPGLENPALPAVIPAPQHMVAGEGVFKLTGRTCISTDTASRATGEYLAERLRVVTGFPVKVISGKPGGEDILITTRDAGPKLGEEGYELTVTSASVVIRAHQEAGGFHGVQSLLQLFPPQVFAQTRLSGVAWELPAVRIEDQPRFKWRGLMLDSGHDFQTKEFVERFIDLMALHKFNVFHWHLTDLGTWSLEIKGRGKLQDSSTRGDGVKPGFYTQNEIREVVQYAARRHIVVMPEIDMPGHEPAALIAYPELDCPLPRVDKNGRPARPWEYCVGNEKTYAFLEEVLTQVVDLFPSRYIHIGGDECPKDRWNRCPLCQAKMKAEGLKNGEELQSYFVRRMEGFLRGKGRHLVGWDEIIEGGLAPDATVMSWRGMGGGMVAARAGHDVVMAPTEWTYFDYPNTTLQKVYGFEPVPKELSVEEGAHILGAQAQMWTDGHPSENQIDGLVYPRAAALAEVVWSPAEARDYSGFVARLRVHALRLAALGVHASPIPKDSVLVGVWSPAQTSPAPKIVEWPLAKSISAPGRYDIVFQYDHGKSRFEIHGVDVLDGGKVIASEKHFGCTGSQNISNIFQVQIPALSGGDLTLRATVSTDWGPESYGRVLIEKGGD